MMKHPETMHEVDGTDHEDCVDIAKELLDDVKSKNYPEHIIELIEGILGELEEYEGDEAEEGDQTDYEDDGKESAKNPDQQMEEDGDGMSEVGEYAKEEVAKKKK